MVKKNTMMRRNKAKCIIAENCPKSRPLTFVNRIFDSTVITSQLPAMSTPREGPNPLRPYYIPPSVGLPVGSGPTGSAASQYATNQASSTSNAKTSFGSSARDILSDLDYSEYLTDASPTSAEVVKGLVDQALWRYTSVLLAQPFEVAKTVLQVQLAGSAGDGAHGTLNDDMRRRPERYREELSDVRLCADTEDKS